MQNFDLDFLLQRESAPVVATVTLKGVAHQLRNVDVLQDFLIIFGTAQGYLEMYEQGLDGDANQQLAQVSGQLITMRDEAYRCIQMLVPTLDRTVLERDYARLGDAQVLLFHLVKLAREAAPTLLKKNSAGIVKETKRRSGRARRSKTS